MIKVEITATWFGSIPVYSGITSLDLIGAVLSTGIFVISVLFTDMSYHIAKALHSLFQE